MGLCCSNCHPKSSAYKQASTRNSDADTKPMLPTPTSPKESPKKQKSITNTQQTHTPLSPFREGSQCNSGKITNNITPQESDINQITITQIQNNSSSESENESDNIIKNEKEISNIGNKGNILIIHIIRIIITNIHINIYINCKKTVCLMFDYVCIHK